MGTTEAVVWVAMAPATSSAMRMLLGGMLLYMLAVDAVPIRGHTDVKRADAIFLQMTKCSKWDVACKAKEVAAKAAKVASKAASKVASVVKKVGGMLMAAAAMVEKVVMAVAPFLMSFVKATQVPKDYDFTMGQMPNEYRYIQEYKWYKSEGEDGVGEAGKTGTQVQAQNMWSLWPSQPMNQLLQEMRADTGLAQKIDAGFNGMKAEPAIPTASPAGSGSGSASVPKYLEPYPDQEKLTRSKQDHTVSTAVKGFFP